MSKLDILGEFWEFLLTRKKFWLVPIVVVLFFFVLLVISTPAVLTPFIYPF